MKFSVQGTRYGNYIQTYATVLEKTIPNFQVGKPALLHVELTTSKGNVYSYYAHYGGGEGKLNIAVPEWITRKGEAAEIFFQKIEPAEFVNAIPAITLNKPDDDRVKANKTIIENATLEPIAAKLSVRVYTNRSDRTYVIKGKEPNVNFDPRGVEIKQGKYAGAPYLQLRLGDRKSPRMFRLYHNHGKTRAALATGRNFYTIRFLEVENSKLRILYQKKEERDRLILAEMKQNFPKKESTKN